jgi:cytochrome c oxidase subunit 2
MITELRCVLLFAALSAATNVLAAEELPIPPDEFVHCTVCHGVQLMGNQTIKGPRLSGMESWYVEMQLRNFRDGTRGLAEGDEFGIDMQPMAAALTDEQIREVADFVAANRSPAPEVTVSGDVAKGKALYSTCAACHGADAKGNEVLASPDLTTTNDWYLVTQLKNYRDGSRGNQSGDTYGAMMSAAARRLSDDEAILDVVAYINTLRNH